MRNRDALRFEGVNVGGRISAARVVGVSDRRFPTAIWSRERSVDRVEGVLEERVHHGGRFSIGCDDIEGLHRNNFGRRDGVTRPVPVWHSQVLGCGNPALFIHLVCICDLKSMLLHHLLDNMIDISMTYKSRR